MPLHCPRSCSILTAIAVLSASGSAVSADTTMYADEASFLAAIPSGASYQEDFGSLIFGYAGSARLFGPTNGFAFEVTSTGSGLFSFGDNLLTNSAYADLVINCAGQPTAVSGYFWVADADMQPAAGDLAIAVAGTTFTVTDPTPGTFIGFVTDGEPITSITLTPIDPFDGEPRWATTESVQLHASVATGPCALPAFASVVKTPASQPSPWDAVAVDWDDDGDLDVLMTCSQGSVVESAVRLAINDGDGNFTITNTWSGMDIFGAKAITAFDVDGDGDEDVITGDDSLHDDRASIMLWVRNGNDLAAPVPIMDVPDGDFGVASEFESFAYGDFDADGDIDFAVAGNSYPENMGAVRVFTNSSGSFTLTSHLQVGAPGETSNAIASGDMNGDGVLDLVCPLYEDNDLVGIFLGNGDGTFQAAITYPTPDEATGVAIADIDGDGDQDFAVVSIEDVDGTFRVYTNVDGSGTAYSVQERRPAEDGLSNVAFADLEGDGDMDALITDRGGNRVLYYLNDGTGTYVIPAVIGTGIDVYAVVPADFTGDGAVDLALPDTFGNLAFFKNECVETVCPADLSGDGVLNNTDINLFVSAFIAEQAEADISGDDNFNNTDINQFIQFFLMGCH